MNTLELMTSEENLIRALNEDILPGNKNLVLMDAGKSSYSFHR